MGMRSLERSVIKQRCRDKYGNTKNFREEWHRYQYAKRKARIEQLSNDGNITVIRNKNTQKKKQRHIDNGRVLGRQMRMMREFFANIKNNTEEKKTENAD